MAKGVIIQGIMPRLLYTQREWDRTVGYGTDPDEYSIDKIKTVIEDEFGIDHPQAKKKEK